jgi:hypothetical protein
MGTLPEYANGFHQFQAFLAAVRTSAEAESAEGETEALVRRLIIEVATETFEGDAEAHQMALELVQSRPEWRTEYERLAAELGPPLRVTQEWEFTLKRGNAVVEKFRLGRSSGVASVGGLRPGDYSLYFETGRLIWQLRLKESDLLLAAAYPSEPLELAADTGGAGNRPTLEERLLDGEVTVRVFAGFECGQMEIETRFLEEHEGKK